MQICFIVHIYMFQYSTKQQDHISLILIHIRIIIIRVFIGVWMLIEGVTLVIKTSNRALRYSGSNKSKIRNQKLFFGWGFPALLVVLGASIGFITDTYMDEVTTNVFRRCWLDKRNAVYYATVFAPLCLTYGICILIFGKMLFFIYGMSKSSEQFTPRANGKSSGSFFDGPDIIHIKVTLRSFGLLFFILGIPLIFSFLSGK